MNPVAENRPVFEQGKQQSTTGEQQTQAHNTGRWTGEEHSRFLQGLQEHGKVWKSIATVVKTRSIVQVRTHAQKYFMKINRGDGPASSSKPSTSATSNSPSSSSKDPSDKPSASLMVNAQVSKTNSLKSVPCKMSGITKSKSYAGVSNLGGESGFSMDTKPAYNYQRNGNTTTTSNSTTVPPPASTSAKPRARKFDEMGNEQFQTTTTTKPTEKTKKKAQNKPRSKKASKTHGQKGSTKAFDRGSNSFQPLPYYGPHPAPGISYSASLPSLNDRQGAHSLDNASSRKPAFPAKKSETRNKRARLSKNNPANKSRHAPYQNRSILDNTDIHTSPTGMGDSPTAHISQPLSCPDFTYYSQDTSYSYPSKPDIDEISEQMAHVAQIPSCDSETEDTLDLENLLLKENLLSSGKKEWPIPVDDKVPIPDEFGLQPEDSKLGMLDCDLKLKVPGNESFSLPQKFSPSSVMDPPAWTTLSYPEFATKDGDDETFMPMSTSHDENNLFWFGFGNDSFDDLLETM